MIFIEVMKEWFGEFEGEIVWKWMMVNDYGMCMSVLNYGVIVIFFEIKDKFGDFVNISFGFINLDDYLVYFLYFGVIFGFVVGCIING